MPLCGAGNLVFPSLGDEVGLLSPWLFSFAAVFVCVCLFSFLKNVYKVSLVARVIPQWGVGACSRPGPPRAGSVSSRPGLHCSSEPKQVCSVRLQLCLLSLSSVVVGSGLLLTPSQYDKKSPGLTMCFSGLTKHTLFQVSWVRYPTSVHKCLLGALWSGS